MLREENQLLIRRKPGEGLLPVFLILSEFICFGFEKCPAPAP